MKKKAPALQHVNEPLLQVLQPEQVEVEVCRSEELDRRRGLTHDGYPRKTGHPTASNS